MSSPTELSPILPSLSELLAQERLTNLIRPCFQHILDFIQRKNPNQYSHIFKNLYQYKDEFLLLIEGILQWSYLHFHSALIGEHFYGLKRTANHRIRSLIFAVFLPYIKRKLNLLHEKMMISNNNNNTDDRNRTFSLVLQLLPKLQLLLEGLCWLYRLSYAFGLTKYYSPTLQLANVKLTYAKDPSPLIQSASIPQRLLTLISQIISNGIYVIQIIDWWNNNFHSKNDNPLPVQSRAQSMPSSQRQCLLCRQTCFVPTVILGSGYVYCYQCISNYVQRYHRCPTTNQPITIEHLRKLSSYHI